MTTADFSRKYEIVWRFMQAQTLVSLLGLWQALGTGNKASK